MAVEDVLRLLTTNPVYRDRVVHTQIIEPEPPRYGTLDTPLPNCITSFLDQNSIRLYTHQCDAINRIRAGKNVIITTQRQAVRRWRLTFPFLPRLTRIRIPVRCTCTRQKHCQMTSSALLSRWRTTPEFQQNPLSTMGTLPNRDERRYGTTRG